MECSIIESRNFFKREKMYFSVYVPVSFRVPCHFLVKSHRDYCSAFNLKKKQTMPAFLLHPIEKLCDFKNCQKVPYTCVFWMSLHGGIYLLATLR